MVNLHLKYELTPIINLSGPLTTYGASKSSEAVCEAVAESLRHQWEMEELFERSGEVISLWSGAEAGTVTACAAAGVTLSVAACMTGKDVGRALQLPDTTGMKSEVLLQKGHSVNFGAPLEQMIRLSGANVREVGTVNQTTAAQIHAGLNEHTAAAVFVISHHTSQFGFVQLPEFVALCHAVDVPVIIDAAAQDHQIRRLVASDADLITFSGQKYLAGPTAGIVCGRRELVEAVHLQNKGIGRTMKIGKEAIFGIMAALEERIATDLDSWGARQRELAVYLADQLQNLRGVAVSLERDRVGQPVTRVRLAVDSDVAGNDAHQICQALIASNPSIKPRAHHTDEGWFYLEPNHVSIAELDFVARRLHEILPSVA